MNYNEIELLTDNKRIFVNVDEGKKEFIESTFINQKNQMILSIQIRY